MADISRKVRLPYGASYLEVALPERNTTVLAGKYLPGLIYERQAVLDALRSPIGSRPLRERLGRNDRVVVITTDNTRACPDDRILPPILAELEAVVPGNNITIVIALGLHPPLTRAEMARKLGRRIVASYEVVNHDPGQAAYLGETSRGLPVEVNSRVAAADFRVSTGFIEPHFFAGFSGGRKSIAPGVSSARAIRANHSYAMLEHPAARAGVLEGNPIHEDMLEQAAMARLDFIVNVLLNRDGEITHVFAGDLKAAHEAGCRQARENVLVRLDRPADITLTTGGGAPLDLDLYQAVKGIDTAARVTREGGIIVVAASCHRGVGPEEFRARHAAAGSPAEVLAAIARAGSGGVSWQNQVLARAQLKHRVLLVSELDDADVAPMMVTPVPSVAAALGSAFDALGKDARLAVIPEGPLVLPMLGEG